MFCSECGSAIEIHADGTALCSCASLDYDPGKGAKQLKSEMPESWDSQDEIARKMKESYEYTN